MRVIKITLFLFVVLVAATTFIACEKKTKEPNHSPKEDDTSQFVGEYEKKILLEQFTSEYCSACPGVDRYLDELIATRIPKGKIIRIAYHNCFKNDFLTIPQLDAYRIFWNSSTTFNPAVMIDRVVYEGTDRPIIDITKCMDTEHPRHGFIPLYINPALSKMSPVRFDDTHLSVNEKNNIYALSINGEVDKRYHKDLNKLYITAFLVCDKIPAQIKGPIDPLDEHNNAARAVFTPIFGDPLQLADGKFSKRYEIKLTNDPETEYIRAVFFVHYYNANDLKQNEVLQADEAYIQ